MELNVLLTIVKCWNKMVVWAAACSGLALSTHYGGPSDWLGLADLLLQAGGDGTEHQMCSRTFRPPRGVNEGQRGVGAGSASPSKLVAKYHRRNNHILSNRCWITRRVWPLRGVNIGYWGQKLGTVFTIKHRFKEKRPKKKKKQWWWK